ncbi:MAG TPA: amino acid permease [Acidimicrobiales bacterium]|nr:amino acid permease [Acidimicrobiales bacterium]
MSGANDPSVPPGLGGPRPAVRGIELPEGLSYRLKKRLLGPPLVTERLQQEKLSKVLALGVLAPDMISSTAYGSEEILNQLVQYVGVAAFTLLLPITAAILVVLVFVTLSYREVVMVYTKAGGSYVVSRDNFGPRIAQIAASALIIDYILTVAVQTAAGTDALTSAFSTLAPYHVYITVAIVLLMTWGNLRGLREAGKIFALPTYLFVLGVGSLVVVGLIRTALGQLHAHSLQHPGVVAGHTGSGLLMGASVLIVLRAFANGGASLTGLEAVSNGVATFREPTGANARRVLVLMATILGSLVLGVSLLAHVTHAVPYVAGTPTVLSQEARYVFGIGTFGHAAFYFIQAVTMLILWTGGNTSFNGFPNLASFVAKDAFLPRQLMRRGHRLVFSNGIIILAVLSIALLVATNATLSSLVAMYAIGVFVGFTMAGAGMVKHHLRERQQRWRRKVAINGGAAALSFAIVAILAVVKFTQGAWLVVVTFPLLFLVLIHLHRIYSEEQAELEHNVQHAVEAPTLKRHAVLVFVERLDLASARAIQYARSLSPDEPRAVHFVLDTRASRELEEQWTRLGLSRVSLEVLECPDRRLARAALELVAEIAGDGQTEVSVLLPRRGFEGVLGRVLHDQTGDRIAAVVSQLPNVSATIIPYPLGKRRRFRLPEGADILAAAEARAAVSARGEGAQIEVARAPGEAATAGLHAGALPGTTPIGELRWRQRARVAGRIRSVRVQPGAGISSLEATLVDPTGQLLLVFQGRRLVPGIEPGARLLVEGMVGERTRRTAMINPSYTLLSSATDSDSSREA